MSKDIHNTISSSTSTTYAIEWNSWNSAQKCAVSVSVSASASTYGLSTGIYSIGKSGIGATLGLYI